MKNCSKMKKKNIIKKRLKYFKVKKKWKLLTMLHQKTSSISIMKTMQKKKITLKEMNKSKKKQKIQKIILQNQKKIQKLKGNQFKKLLSKKNNKKNKNEED